MFFFGYFLHYSNATNFVLWSNFWKAKFKPHQVKKKKIESDNPVAQIEKFNDGVGKKMARTTG